MSEASTAPSAEITRVVDGREIPVAGVYRIDPAHTAVDFVARHMMVSKVRGSFPAVSGSLVIAEEPTASSLEVHVDVSSVTTREDARDGHLRSADFFDVENHPEMVFVANSARPEGDGWAVDGELTIKKISRPVVLDVEYLGAVKDPYGFSRIGFSATAEINREDFDLGFNAVLEAGGVVISKTVRIEIEAELIKES